MEQDEYFSVHSPISVNLAPLNNDAALPEEEAFLDEIPPLFRVASECIELEDAAERELQTFGKDDSQSLLKYLSVQNEKINMLLSYVLLQQNPEETRYNTETFGAGHLTVLFDSANQWQHGQLIKVKIFLESPAAAIYCYGQVSQVEQTEKGQIRYKVNYVRIQESDRDILIRSALHLQQKILKRRAQARNNPDSQK
ncbi:hypothetical protein [Thaumasiovibrio subtropicus]|uniref:hypothetical protein n=1 Tax=Thaumasiovibrio subtropicus TaxID=1891207 RepID=UPI000B351E81|nr:hypothetical protein [Thaumasiovibrio subtropicus]